jgi:hypothetical protein
VDGSAQAQETRDRLCTFVRQHQLSDSSHNLSQYVSLALYVSPPPELTPSVGMTEMPPDSTQVVEILPLVREFARDTDLHFIWIRMRPQYDAVVNSLHDSLTKMIVSTNAYLKMPANTSSGSRFAVVLEPLLDPGQTNARVYGADYVVVTSPTRDGAVRMDEIRHVYLHFELEPLLYARASSMDRLLPFLKVVRSAPLEYTYRSDIVSLVTECMIRAVEARTMETGVAPYKAPTVAGHSQFAEIERQRHETEARAEAVRQAQVQRDMQEGYVLTRYFYDSLVQFEKDPQSFKETIGEIVYGMDVPSELNRAKRVTFLPTVEDDVVRRGTRHLQGLDLAELKLMQGDVAAATALAQKALSEHAGEPGRAEFLLARAAVMQGKPAEARRYFEATIGQAKDPRLLAWSHIYLGRMDDLENRREAAIGEYQQALLHRDGQMDTRQAAERGLQAAYGPAPGRRPAQEEEEDDDGSGAAPPAAGAGRPAEGQPGPQPGPQSGPQAGDGSSSGARPGPGAAPAVPAQSTPPAGRPASQP